MTEKYFIYLYRQNKSFRNKIAKLTCEEFYVPGLRAIVTQMSAPKYCRFYSICTQLVKLLDATVQYLPNLSGLVDVTNSLLKPNIANIIFNSYKELVVGMVGYSQEISRYDKFASENKY